MGLTLVNLNEIGNIKTHTTGGYIDSDINYRRRELDTTCEFIDTPSDYDGATHDGLPFIDNNDYMYQETTNVPLMPGTKVIQRNVSRHSIGASGVYRLSVVTGLKENVLVGIRIDRNKNFLQPFEWVYETRTINAKGKFGKVFSYSTQKGYTKLDLEACKKASDRSYLYGERHHCASRLNHDEIDLDYMDGGHKSIRPPQFFTGCKRGVTNAVAMNKLQEVVQRDAMREDFMMSKFKKLNPDAYASALEEYYNEIDNQGYGSRNPEIRRKAVVKNYVEKVRGWR